MLPDDGLSRDEHKRVLNEPFVITACLVLRSLEKIAAEIENLRCAQGTNGCIQTSRPWACCS